MIISKFQLEKFFPEKTCSKDETTHKITQEWQH